MTQPQRELNRSDSNTADLDFDMNSLLNNRELQDILRDIVEESGGRSNWVGRIFHRNRNANLAQGTAGSRTDVTRSAGSALMEIQQGLLEILNSREIELSDLDSSSDFGEEDDEDDTENEQDAHNIIRRQNAIYFNREVPLRHILPTTPPPSPLQNRASMEMAAANYQRRYVLMMRPIQAADSAYPVNSTPLRTIDANGCVNGASTCSPLVPPASPIDRNNELPATNEFLQRYGTLYNRSSDLHNANGSNSSQSSAKSSSVDQPFR